MKGLAGRQMPVLQQADNGKVSVFSGKRIMCFAGSSFQFLALLCIFSEKRNCYYESLDLYVYPSFKGVQNYIECFCDLVRVRACYVNENYDNPPRIPKLAAIKFLETVVHSRRGKLRLLEAFPRAKTRSYDVVMCPSASDHTITARQVCATDGFTVFYDDGVGSHNGNVFKSNFCLDKVISANRNCFSRKEWYRNKFKALARILGGSKVQHKIRALYLFNPGLFEANLYPNVDIEEIIVPAEAERIRQCISPELDGSIYEGVQAIFLSLPGDLPEDVLDVERMAIRLFASSFNGFAVRPHPRRNPDDFKSLGVKVIDGFDSWEMLLLEGIVTEDMILVGFGSSAQVHPKTIFNIEPIVVFLHGLLPGGVKASISVNLMCNDLKARYKDGSKVLSFESFKQCEAALLQVARLSHINC